MRVGRRTAHNRIGLVGLVHTTGWCLAHACEGLGCQKCDRPARALSVPRVRGAGDEPLPDMRQAGVRPMRARGWGSPSLRLRPVRCPAHGREGLWSRSSATEPEVGIMKRAKTPGRVLWDCGVRAVRKVYGRVEMIRWSNTSDDRKKVHELAARDFIERMKKK